jgi:hypothetical protein
MYYVDRLNNGQYPKDKKRLAIGFSFKCAKHLRITGQYLVNREKVSYHCVL